MFTQNYRLLTQEGHLTMSSLLGGLNSIRNANIDDTRRGLFYSGLFELATGFERLMKIVLILDHKLNNKLKNPTNKELKAFGHNIKELYESCSELPENYGLRTRLKLCDKKSKIVSTLTEFAKGSRYYNLDVLTNHSKNEDPISLWLSVIDDHIWSLRSDVRTKLQNDSIQVIDRSGMSGKWQQNVDGEWITKMDFYYLMSATEKANPHIVWSIIETLHPFHGVLRYQCNKLQELYAAQDKENEIPFMFEFFPFFLTPKNSALRKKQWAWGK
ncbi:hypothetical protein DS2_17602 [Catenovulum agarivorans DS-2]|uniref:Uncharacterized protein n=1 Tax=Catenovulum agarivorans DS-2 TaxID=1328313 RepID=W7QSM3_9ALTE|nr:hypothetical protein [Catenovulum agarivorans]EWH08380.1 hypothetical protein DS2_17602 [Catenovulum agarivorans DS-2]